MQIKDQAAYDDWKAKNQDGLGSYCFEWAEKIMNKLEKEIEEKKPENPDHYARERMWKVSNECDSAGVLLDLCGVVQNLFSLIAGNMAERWINLKSFKYKGFMPLYFFFR